MKAMIFKFKKFLLYTLVIILISINKLLIRIIPFSKLIGFYTNANEFSDSIFVEESKVKLIRHSIYRVNRILFWKPVCFEQSLTVLLLARFFRVPGSIYFGIFKSESGSMLAHAWTRIGCYWVTGDDLKERFTVVYKLHYIP